MKYRLGTLLLFVSVCAAVIGLVKSRADARNAMAHAELEFDYNLTAARNFAEVRQLLELKHLLDPNFMTPEGQKHIRDNLVFAMWKLYRFERRIDLIYPDGMYAVTYGRDILVALGCDDPNDFTKTAAKSLFPPENWPEYFDPDTPEYVEFHDFLSRCSSMPSAG